MSSEPMVKGLEIITRSRFDIEFERPTSPSVVLLDSRLQQPNLQGRLLYLNFRHINMQRDPHHTPDNNEEAMMRLTFSLSLVALFAMPGAHRPGLATPLEQGSSVPPSITSAVSAEGLTLRVTATCPQSGGRCPFRAEIVGAPALVQTIRRVEYSYTPDQRTAVPIADRATRYRFEGAQYGGELIYADVILEAERKIALQITIPFAASVRPALPRGLRFEDKYQMEYLEGTPSDWYQFRVRLRGEPEALKRVLSVQYRLPEAYSNRGQATAYFTNEFLLEAGGPGRKGWNIVAVIRWMNGKVSTHELPFRPEHDT